MIRPVVLILALAPSVARCAPSSVTPQGAASAVTPAAAPARAVFDDIEQRLVSARSVRLKAQLRAEGSITASLSARLLVAGRRVRFDVDGVIAGKPARARLVSDGARLSGSGGAKPFAIDTPAALAEGLLVGLARMGLLHNAAQLADGEPPDGTDGAARSWLGVDAFRGGPPEPLSFALTVKGGSVAEATLTLDPATRLPRERRLTVHFKRGDMRVTEIYESLTLDDVRDADFTET